MSRDQENYMKLKTIAKSYDFDLNEHEETVQHLLRCAELSRKFGEYLNLPQESVSSLEECTLLHDLGKFNIDSSVLYKEGSPTDEEYSIIKSHVNFDCSKCNSVLSECIHYHHERVDCRGYNKLDFSCLHDFVKIITLVDCYDAMRHSRCYRKQGLPKEIIFKEIYSNLGFQFDRCFGMRFLTLLVKIGEL